MGAIDAKTLAVAKASAKKITLNNTTSTTPEWTSGKKFEKDQLLTYMGKIYKVLNPISSSTTSPDLDLVNYQLFSGGGSGGDGIKFPDFTPDHDYSFGECIVHNFCLMSSKASFTSNGTFDSNDWNVISDMHKNIYDTNFNGIVDNAEHALIADKSLETELVQSWKPNTDYKIGQNIVFGYETYTVTSNFKSGTTFDKTNLILSSTGNHNIMLNLQGGDVALTEFYHLKKVKHDLLDNMSDVLGKLVYNSKTLGDMDKSVYDTNNDGIVDKAATLDGLTSTVLELNFMHGVTSNVQAQINALSSVGNFTGSVPTKADIATTFTSPKSKDMVIVVADETHGGTSTIYLYSGTAWSYAGAFTATIRDFTVNPINVTTESTGLYLEARIDSLIARKTDVPNIPNLSLITTYTQTDTDITNAINKAHDHANKTLLDTYTQTNVDLGDAVNKKHSHTNKIYLDKFSEDSTGNPLYNGNPIVGTGGGGISNLSSFNTTDLADSTNHRYVTDSEKTNLQNLTAIVSSQTTMNNTLTTISGEIPTDASATNKLVSSSTLSSKLSALKFAGLSDVATPLVPDSFVMVNHAGNGLIYLNSITNMIKIQKVTDGNGLDFFNIPDLEFKNLIGTQDSSTGNLSLKLKAFSTDLIDMPTTYVDGTIPVCNAGLQKYELKKISDLTNSKGNYTKLIAQTDWQLDTTLNIYTAVVPHNLNSKDLIVGFLDKNNKNIRTIDWGIYNGTDANQVLVSSATNDPVRIVVNCSQGAVGNGTGTSGGTVTLYPSDFLDDTRVRTDKAYSSSQVMTVLNNYAQKNTVYTQTQANSIFSLKMNEHTHANIDTLTYLTSDADNNLYFHGTKVLTGNLQPFTYQNHWADKTYSSDSLLVDVSAVFATKGYNAILDSELTVVNNIPSSDAATDALKANQVHLIAIDNSIVVLDVLIPPASTQKYLLGISPNLKVMISGKFTANYYLTAY